MSGSSDTSNGADRSAREAPLLLIVDDDEGIRAGLQDLLRSVGYETMAFGSTRDFLDAELPDRAGCLILDVRLPGGSGLDLQNKLASIGNKKPIIFMTGFADVPMSVRAMKAGAVDFLPKPFGDQDMLDAVSVAVDRDVVRRTGDAALVEGRALLASLTPRETEVMTAVIEGLLNKQIAFRLGLSEITVKIHRGSVMRKLKATTVADLVRKVEQIRSAGST